MRSIFLVPAGNAALFDEALDSGVQAVAIDVTKGAASDAAPMLKFLRERGRRSLARIHALTSGFADSDLDAVMAHAPYGIILPQACGGRDVQHLGAKLAVREAENGLEDGSTRILAAAADLPEAIFALGSLAGATRRLLGLLWDGAALAGALGVGEDADILAVARAQLVFAAAAAGAPALVDAAASPDFSRARRDGFGGAVVANRAAAEACERIFA
ncbi:citrate lyase subunit beta/citryl-CoA lyase [Rhodoblastus acidophilus]|uniref:aldolase/citrate lyase family protein n=1 Tax=Rhodoblastus acidophilus TaxID=1074 RepID=UPI002225040F|nr:aldolase/citrate lyase family protein [Rhodoblastus acidophilus]MCW2284999.1 citrate lyase subunit beta/citryl-CoA lyase [Rhodoblastus acidophilus]MCW2333937.1 citrate lyase subunit beta/citryl-CoA lyase [Rhodoblastus acidophilus]